MKTVRVFGSILLLALATTTHAVDSGTFGCESKSNAAAGKWGAGRGGCLSKCIAAQRKGDTTKVCAPGTGFPDAVTGACITANDTKYKAAVAKACPAGTFPSCGSYATAGDPTTYADNQIASLSGLIDASVSGFVICDEDPLLNKCEFGTSKNLSKLAGVVLKCLTGCYSNLQLKGDSTRMCTPAATGDRLAPLDATTHACLQGAIDKTKATIVKACPTLPPCGLYPLGIDALVGLVTDNTFGNYAVPSSNPYCAP
jgi:hypothetical protein